MLESYEAIYDHGQIRWLADKPPVEEGRVIVTILSPQVNEAPQTHPTPSSRIAGKGRILGNIVAPASLESDWDVLK